MDEEELAQSLRTLEFYKVQLQTFDQQYEYLAATISEHNRAIETMKAYKELEEGSETLVPIGASSFLPARVFESNRAMVGIGADIVVDTNIDDAISKLQERIKEIEDAMKTIGLKYQEMATKAAELSAKIQELYNQE